MPFTQFHIVVLLYALVGFLSKQHGKSLFGMMIQAVFVKFLLILLKLS
jgi:hypothetical protein